MTLDLIADRAACAGWPTEAFFPIAAADVTDALTVCDDCPVQAECLTWALEHHELGVWGGTTEQERSAIRAGKRPERRRNRKNSAECGTAPGYESHRYRGEPACGPCRRAKAAMERERYAQRKRAQEAAS